MSSSRLVPAVLLVLAALWAAPSAVRAQPEAFEEEPDPTRLDVERLPPEAIEITRDLYSHGFFVEGLVGGRGFTTGAGRVSAPGLWASVGFGYELFSFLWLKVAAEGSIHATDGPYPPSATAYELLGAYGEAKLQVNFSARVAAWVAGEAGVIMASGDVLPAYGFDQARNLGLMYGGSAGFDWHMVNRHHSIGVMGGARLYPSLEDPHGEQTLGAHGAAYIRYVF